MFANAKALVVIASCAFVAYAQGGPSASVTGTAPPSQSSASIPPCVLACVTTAAPQGGCSGFTDVQCLCTSQAFQAAAQSCLQANCTAADAQAAQALQAQQCATLSSGSASGAPSTASTKSSTATSASATHSATSSSAAMALSAPISFGGVLGSLVASAGALVGAAFVL